MPRTNESKVQKETYLQAGQYLLEQFSIPALRSHATVAVVDRNRIQFYHATHSVILVSSAIAFSTFDGEDGLDKFIAILIAFNRLSLEDNGILHSLPTGPHFHDNDEVMMREVDTRDTKAVRIQEGSELEFLKRDRTHKFTLTLGELISREPSLAGRSTVVLHARTEKWEGSELVVKFSWPGSGRVAENEFLVKATRVAKSKHGWALKHLPQILYSQDVVFERDSAHESVEKIFGDERAEIDGYFHYEQRVLRIIIQERLYPLKTLKNVREIAQVLVDIICSGYFDLILSRWTLMPVRLVHWWLYDKVGILHRDLSLNNIMYRRILGKVYGVLVDYDLASWRESLAKDYKKTSEQRTGTPPFMAQGLLDGTDPLHLYRHDLEALFYVMLILATRYEINRGIRQRVPPKDGKLGFEDWFNTANYRSLGAAKWRFLTKMETFNVSPSFKGFHNWLERFRASFSFGFQASYQYGLQQGMASLLPTGAPGQAEEKATFDYETLGGYVTYSAFIESTRALTGELEGLIIRDSPSASAAKVRVEAAVARNTRSQTARRARRRAESGKRKN